MASSNVNIPVGSSLASSFWVQRPRVQPKVFRTIPYARVAVRVL